MEPKLIDMKNYTRTGEGANGCSYDNNLDDNLMVKMYNTSYPREPIFSEYEVVKKVYEAGFMSPEPGVLVTDGERIGIEFKKIKGKRSYATAIAQEPDRLKEYAVEFAKFGKKLHSMECPEGVFPDIKDSLRMMIKADKAFTDPEKDKIYAFLDSVPDANTAIHGDFHVGNIVTTLPKGASFDEPHEIVMIDLGYFSHGFPLLDLGILNICMNKLDPDYSFSIFHITRPQENQVWEYFVDEYFFGEEMLAEKYFWKGITKDELEVQLEKYLALQAFLVSFNAGGMYPYLVELVRKAFEL